MANASELLTRAVEEVVPRALAEEKLKSGELLRIYFGIDPTGSKLHLGHSVPLLKMRAFQDAGHHVILVIGSFTAMIGDPSGQDEMRPPLTKEHVQKNFETYIEQARLILDMSKLEVRYNHEWLEKIDFGKIVELASYFTVQQMLQRDMFKERMKKGSPIGSHEFLYPVMVGYDSVMLDVDCELGGSDQLFNMLAGRTLQKAYGKRDKFVLTTKLIEGTDGRKMSKTYHNCVYLLDSPKEMYGRLMSIPDNLITLYLECCTRLPADEVKKIEQSTRKGGNPKDAKMLMAREIVTMYHSQAATMQAEKEFEHVFSQKGIPDEKPDLVMKTSENISIIDELVRANIVPSKSKARTLVEEGAVTVLNETGEEVLITNLASSFGEEFVRHVLPKGNILKVGKRKFFRIVMK